MVFSPTWAYPSEHVTDLGFRVLLSMTNLVVLPYQNHMGLSFVYLISASPLIVERLRLAHPQGQFGSYWGKD